jgi:hypothetical protein
MAEKFYVKSFRIRERTMVENTPDLAELYNIIDENYSMKKDYEEAKVYYFLCLKIQEKILPENHADL